jgi:CxxC motif-containing protein (DUF1111 family)
MGSATNFLVKQHTGPDSKFPSGSPFGPAVQWYSATVAAVSLGELVDFELLLIDSGGTRGYTSVVYRYYVGSGKLGQQYQHPWANAAGDASISAIAEPKYSYTQHCINAPWGRAPDFLAGKALFDTDWKSGDLRNSHEDPDCNGSMIVSPIDKSLFFAAGALGPGFLQASCYECHVQAGAGHTADSAGDSLQAMMFLGVQQQNTVAPHPAYGDVLRCKTTGSAPPDGQIRVSYSVVGGTFNDGTYYTIRKPAVDFVNLSKGPLDSTVVSSCRISPLLCGAGLLDAVPEDSILRNADSSDRDNDGISGRANFAMDPVDGVRRLGRFGWKASMPSLKGEIAYVANRCLGLTNRYFPLAGGGSGAELSDSSIYLLQSYVALCVPPPRNNWQDASAIRGKSLFAGAGCVKCHIPALRTGSSGQFTELNNLEIQPFTDLLLHDMGDGLADNYSQESALGREWRTAPLWGIGFIADAGGRESYLHDGRAQSIMEAVLWHGGEAEKAKNAVLGLTALQKDDLVAYCKYPFADRLPRPLASPIVSPLKTHSRPGLPVFSIVQNPVRDFARFRLDATGSSRKNAPQLSIFTLRGQCVFRQLVPLEKSDLTWDARANKPGAYIARLSAEGRIYMLEILVTR